MQRLKGLSSVIQKLLGVWTIQAVKWYKKAAEGGDFIAKNNLAVMYLEAEGVKKDIVKAKLLIEEALNGSDIEASKLAKDNWNEYELWKY